MSTIINELKPTILIADDDSPTRMLLRAAITQWNYPVIEAADGENAWEILNDNPSPPRIVILDWLMPKIDGIALCRRIKSEMTISPYIILLTQISGTSHLIQAIDAGADEFLTKPFNHAELRSRLLAGHRIISYEQRISEIMKSNHDIVITKYINFISRSVADLQNKNKIDNKSINHNFNIIFESVLALALQNKSDNKVNDNVLDSIKIIKNIFIDNSKRLDEIAIELKKITNGE